MTNAKKKLVHLFDVTQCVGCKACIVACAETNYPDMLNEVNSAWDGLPANIRVMRLEKARRPVQLLVQCQQCDDAPCVTVCPFGANFHDPKTGNVKTDPNRCIGCGYCVTACPYDVRWLHPKTGLPVKCMGEGCEKLTAAGQLPACVSACPAGARSWGDINDPASEISLRAAKGRTERLLPQKGTNPNFIVVVAK